MEPNVLENYNALSDADKKLVAMFIDELYHKTSKSTSDRAALLGVSVWSDEDCKVFEENKKLFRQ